MSVEPYISEKASKIMKFLGLLYHPGERIYFFPLKDDELAEGEQRTKKAISAKIGSRRFCKTVEKLEALNAEGYGIFITANPLTFPRRLKETVYGVRYLVIESDELTLEAQRAFLAMFKGNIRVAVFTGNRSIHMYLMLRTPIRNPHCLTGKYSASIKAMSRYRAKVTIPEFDDALAGIKAFLSSNGFKYCSRTLSSFHGLVRCPYFNHPETGRMADVEYENSDKLAGYLNDDPEFGNAMLQIDEAGRAEWHRVTGVLSKEETENEGKPECRESREMNTYTPVVSMLYSHDLSTTDSTSTPTPEPTSPEPSPQPTEPTTPVPVQVRQDGRQEGMFLQELGDFDELFATGIPRRGVRRKHHKTIFSAARSYGWSEARMLANWRRILSIDPNNIGLSVDDAVEDLRNEWVAIRDKPYRHWLPVASKLPDLDDGRWEKLRARLKRGGCIVASSVAHIIVDMLYPAIQRAIIPCLEGRAYLAAFELRAACSGHKYKEAMTWLDMMNILRVTSKGYIRGRRTRLYFVNVHLVLYFLGFTADQLVWEPVAKGAGRPMSDYDGDDDDPAWQSWLREAVTTPEELERWVVGL